MTTYLLAFVLAFWAPHSRHRAEEVRAIIADVLTTDGTPEEDLTLLNVAALESGFERSAVGAHGERGPFQIMPPAASYGAKEALRRLRVQGLSGYCGCGVRACPEIVEHRIEKARVYRWAFAPPVTEGEGDAVAGR
jgi:hypothetical protein